MIQEQKETKQILICQITTPNIITKYKLKIGYKGSIMEKPLQIQYYWLADEQS